MERKNLITIILLTTMLFAGCGINKSQFKSTPIPMSKDAMSTFYYLKFLDLSKEEKYKKAQEAIQKAIEYNPSPELFIEYARLLLRNKKIKDAEDILKVGLQKNPGDRELIFFLSDIYSYEKKYYNAYSMLKIFLKENPDDLKAREKMAKLLFQQKEYKTAIEYLLQIPEEKRDYRLHFFLGRCYANLKNRKKAIYHFKRSVELNPDFLRGWAELAYQYELKNDLVSAEKIYSRLLSKGFTNRELILRLIEINIKLGKPEKSYSIAQEFLSDPKDLIRAISIFLREDLYNEAEALLKTIANFRDEYPSILYYNGIIRLKKYNDTKGSLFFLSKIPKDSEVYTAALDLKTRILLNEKKYSQAEKIIQRQLKEDPNNIDLKILLSDVYILDKKLKDAKNIIEDALKENPNNIKLLYQLGTIYYKLNDINSSLSIMKKIIKQDPENPSALNFIGYTYVDQGINIKEGYKLIKKALSLEPDNGYFLDSMAWYYYKVNEYNKAWQYIKKAIKNVSTDPTIWEHYGDIALKLKKVKEAQKGYKNSLLNHSEHPDRIKEKIENLKKSNL